MSAGIRACFFSGGKVRFDGVDPITGEKRFKTVKPLEDKVLRKLDAVRTAKVKGTNLEFRLSPTITAMLPAMGFESKQTLGTEGLLEALATDFAQALRTLSLTLADLKRLSALGSLPISLTFTSKGPVLSVRFRGCDATTVSLLCEELGIFSGIVREDAEWDDSKEVEMAMLFPFAPTGHVSSDESDVVGIFERMPREVETIRAPEEPEWQGMMTPSTNIRTPSSTVSYDHVTHSPQQRMVSSPSGYESMHESDFGDEDPYFGFDGVQQARSRSGNGRAGADIDELQGIYHFLRECEDARRR